MTSKLTISQKKLDCYRVLDDLQKNGYKNINIIQGLSLVDGLFENSCEITLSNKFCNDKENVKNLWNHLKKNNNLTCAYFNHSNIFSGCILDYIKDSECK